MLFYTVKGEGEPLILLHGNGESGRYFIHQINELAEHFTVYAPDTRGHGKSERGEKPMNFDVFADDLLEFTDALGIGSANILGYSDGGNTAITFALKHPDRVKKLILNGANLCPSGVKLRYQIPIVLGYLLVCLISFFDKKAVKNRELLGLMVNHPHIDASELSKLTMPSLVIVGNKDMIKEKHTRLIADSLPNSVLVTLKGGHSVAFDSPDEFNKTALEFLLDK